MLVVEDDAHVAAGIVQGLRAAGFRVDLAVTAAAGLRAAIQDSPKIIIWIFYYLTDTVSNCCAP